MTRSRPPSPPPWVAPLLRWFGRHRRPMPWRARPSPYAIWVSEIMLQQTQVATAIPYFQRFMTRFPTVRKLAAADFQDVLKAWEGLGYYSRARNLHRAAGEVAGRLGGRLPATAAGLAELPGFGPYVAGAVASMAFGERVPAVDGNVVRVFSRFLAWRVEAVSAPARRRVGAFLAPVVPASRPGDFNQALMELGALVCRPRNPACPACPLGRWCRARLRGTVARYPAARAGRRVPHYDVVACVIRRGGRVLVSRRRADQMLGGMWEFPGGKCKEGESLADAARREIREELDVRIRPGRELCAVAHAYSHFRITLHAIECAFVSGRPKPLASDEVRWVPIPELDGLPFPAGDRQIIRRLAGA